MSSAFVREGDDQSLEDISPSITALRVFLTRENNGIQVSERKSFTDDSGRTIFVMTNGLSYMKNDQGKWSVVL
ncbi:MAG: hypothetical protein HOP08_09285 [Cyclobacteriaceae bacterium]|nr:hypothetical protein [Cyclobacteriaceae bacterium]